MLPAGQYSQQYNRHACFYMNLNGVCKKSGGRCVRWNTLDDCDDYVKGSDAVRRTAVPQKLLSLIEWCGDSGMVFVERGDPRFSEKDIREFITFVDNYPQMGAYVVMDKSESADVLITIYAAV